MKKILAFCLVTLSASAFAHGPHYGYGYHRHGGGGWAPWIGGAVVGAVLYDIYNRPVVVQQPPVVVQTPNGIPTVQQQNCTPWTEVQNSDGTVTRTRTCSQ